MLNPRAALGHALTAGANLRCDDRPGAVDALIALGMVRPERAITAVGGIEARDLARFSDLFSLLLRVKWGQQEHSLPALRAQMIEFCRFHFARKGWAVHDRRSCTAEETLARFAEQCAVEFCCPDRCPKCKGRAFLYGGGKVRSCPACDGTGIRPEPGRARARALLMSPQAYRERWEERFRHILAELEEVERRAVARMRSRLVDVSG